jgi:peptide/nickel transport system substrate-binding protein
MSVSKPEKIVSRRRFLQVAAIASGGLALAACAQPSPAPDAKAGTSAATTAPAAATKPAAATAPTSAPQSGVAGAGAGVKGGTLRLAIIGEPPSTDPHWTTANVTNSVTSHYCEPLLTLNSKLEMVPMLAESMDTSSDGLTRTVKLRKNVPFHNGDEMTAEDVTASLTRWAKLSGIGKTMFELVEKMDAPDKYTVVFKMKKPYAVFETALGLRSQHAMIMPKKIVDAAGDKQLSEPIIGTGPYKFLEHVKDRSIRLVRFEQYASRSEPTDGPSGKKMAYADEIRFLPTPDQSVRVAGVQSGDFDYAEGVNPDQYAILKDNKQISTLVSVPNKCPTHYINKKSPLMQDVKLRQAMLAALDMEAALKPAWGSPDFYVLNGGIMPKEGPWYSAVGIEAYNQKNPEKAKQLLKESNYKGEPVRYLTNKEYPNMYQEAVVINQVLQGIGINMKMEVIDWA